MTFFESWKLQSAFTGTAWKRATSAAFWISAFMSHGRRKDDQMNLHFCVHHFSNEKGCLMLIKLADLWWQTFTTTPSTLFRSPACHEPWEGCTAFSLFFCMFTSYWKLNYESLLGNTSSPALKPEFSQTIFTAKNKHIWIIEHIWRSCLL